MSNTELQNAIFPKGERAPADYFTATAWVKILARWKKLLMRNTLINKLLSQSERSLFHIS
jgi:hypothetical protein